MKQIEGVAGAGEIEIEARVLRMQPVVCKIVNSAETQRGPEMISFSGVIVNHIENYFDVRRMQAAHHGLELRDLLAQLPTAGGFPMRHDNTDCFVSLVVR